MEIERPEQKKDDGQRRDALLLKLLKTPPHPRPKRERKSEGPSTKTPRSLDQQGNHDVSQGPHDSGHIDPDNQNGHLATTFPVHGREPLRLRFRPVERNNRRSRGAPAHL